MLRQLAYMQVLHGGLDIGMSQQLLYGYDIDSVFKQMGSIAVAKRMGMDFFKDPCSFSNSLDRPLHASLTVTAVEACTERSRSIATGTLLWLPMKQIVLWMLCRYVFLHPAYQMLRQRHVAIFIAFALHYMQESSVKVQVAQTDVAYFHAPESATVEQTDQDFMLEQLGTLEHSPYLFTAQDNR